MTMTREEWIYKEAEGRCIDLLAAKERGDANTICPQSYRAGFMDGAKWADQYPQWIPVEEELPPKMDKWTKASDYVLVYTNEGEWLIGRYWHDGDGWAVSGFTKAKVTHWMPIVPPRKEE